MTAFDETAVLERAGRHGWHVVDHATLHLVLEASPWQWEHRRALAAVGGRHQRLVDEGWRLIGTTWFPWAYYSRRTDRPAEPEDG